MSTNFQMDPIIRRIDRSEKHEAAIDGIVVEASVAGGWFSEKWFYCVTRPQAHSGWANIRIDRDIAAPDIPGAAVCRPHGSRRAQARRSGEGGAQSGPGCRDTHQSMDWRVHG